MPYADVTQRRSYHAGYMQQWRARKAQQTPPSIPGSPQLEAAPWSHEVQRLHTAAGQVHTEALAANTIVATTLMLRRVTALVLELTGVLVELSTVAPPPTHRPGRPATSLLQTQDLAALPWPQWHQEARTLAEQLDKAFEAWSVPPPAQRVLRQMAALLGHITIAVPGKAA
jgi:hypothetical protein